MAGDRWNAKQADGGRICGPSIEADPSDHALASIAARITQDMEPIGNHQGRGDTKRKLAAVLLKRVLKDMQERATHVGTA